MKIGVVGVGNIAKKAYLPTYAASRQLADIVFLVRPNRTDTMHLLSENYGFNDFVSNFEEMLESDLSACMIHSATNSHFELAKACLSQGIHVFVDKPVSQNLKEVTELEELANEKNLIFMVGFNRRFVPMLQNLKQVSGKRILRLQKNTADFSEPVKFGIYDMFSHLLDTAVYLLDEKITKVESYIQSSDDIIEYVVATLHTQNSVAQLTMDFSCWCEQRSL